MQFLRFFAVFIFGLFLGLDIAHAKSVEQHTDNVEIELFSDTESEIIAKFTINDGWHIYYQNPGEIGKPTFVENLNIENPIEITAKSIPQVVKAYDIMDEYIYKNQAYLKLQSAQSENIKFTLNFVECADVCKTQKIVFDLKKLPNTSPDKWQEVLHQAEQTFPMQATADFDKKHRQIILNLALQEVIKIIPEQRNIISDEEFSLKKDGDKTILSWQNINEQNKLKSLLIITPEQSFDISINYDVFDWSYFLYIALLAFLGGIILNAMPCVFPILSLKIFGIIKNYDGRRHYQNALTYTLGVLCCFLSLAAILDILKEGGKAIGWGFQLQSPLFVSVMMLLFFVLFLYMIEALPFPSLISNKLHKVSSANMFLTGFFAVLIASPCTGPFMGAVIGYAFMQTDLEMYAVFSALALGYALPFALAEIYPTFLRRILPKPGEWMKNLKMFLAIPVLLTCIWLSSVLVAQIYSHEGINRNNLNWREYDIHQIQTEVASGKKVFIDFTAEWCLTCMFNEKTKLSSKKFADFVHKNNVELFKADLTESNEKYNDALNAYGRDGIPVYVYYKDKNYRVLPIFFDIDELKE